MNFRKEEEMFRLFFTEGSAYPSIQIAEFLNLEPKYFSERFKKSFFEKLNPTYYEQFKRKRLIYTRYKYDAYILNENILTTFYRLNKDLKTLEIERFTDVLASLSEGPLTIIELILKINNSLNDETKWEDDLAFKKSYERTVTELRKLGVIYRVNNYKPYQYAINHTILNRLEENELIDLIHFVDFMANTHLISVQGYILLDVLNYYIKWKYKINNIDVLVYKYVNFGRILDEYKCKVILEAFSHGKKLKLRYYTKDTKVRAHSNNKNIDTRPKLETYVPLYLLFDHQYGRWYFIGVLKDDIRILKLEGIADLEVTDESVNLSTTISIPSNFDLKNSWLLSNESMELIKIKFNYEATVVGNNNFIKERVIRQGRWGRIIEEGPSYLIYEIAVNGVQEIKPWIRSFGSSAEVLTPKSLRTDLKNEWLKILEEYQDV